MYRPHPSPVFAGQAAHRHGRTDRRPACLPACDPRPAPAVPAPAAAPDIHARRIRHRELAGDEQLKDTAIALAAERGLSKAWWRGTCLMLRLVLAVREADGDEDIPEETLDDLPHFRNAVADVLRHASLTSAGILRPRRGPRPVVLRKPQRSCKYCDCWGTRATCPGCALWKRQPHLHPVGDCGRCGRPRIPLLDGLCRACCLHIDQHGPQARAESWTQLWFGGDLAPRLAVRSGTLGYVAPQQKARVRAAARRPPDRRQCRRTWPSRGRGRCSTPAAIGAASPSGRWTSCHR